MLKLDRYETAAENNDSNVPFSVALIGSDDNEYEVLQHVQTNRVLGFRDKVGLETVEGFKEATAELKSDGWWEGFLEIVTTTNAPRLSAADYLQNYGFTKTAPIDLKFVVCFGEVLLCTGPIPGASRKHAADAFRCLADLSPRLRNQIKATTTNTSSVFRQAWNPLEMMWPADPAERGSHATLVYGCVQSNEGGRDESNRGLQLCLRP